MIRSIITCLLLLLCLYVSLIEAMESSSNDSPVSENKISIVSYLSEKLQLHEKSNWPDCCKYNTSSIKQLVVHFQNNHRIKREFFCTTCKILYSSAKRAASCLIKHNNNRFFTCPLCLSTHTRFENLMNHCKIKCRFNHQFEIEVFRSGKKDSKKKQQQLLSHKEAALALVNNRIAQIPLTCCSHTILTFDQLSAHLYIDHKTDDIIQCPGCLKTHENADKAASCVLYAKNNSIFASEDGIKKGKTLRALAGYIKKTVSSPNNSNSSQTYDALIGEAPDDFPFDTVEIAPDSHPTDKVIERVFTWSSYNRF